MIGTSVSIGDAEDEKSLPPNYAGADHSGDTFPYLVGRVYSVEYVWIKLVGNFFFFISLARACNCAFAVPPETRMCIQSLR